MTGPDLPLDETQLYERAPKAPLPDRTDPSLRRIGAAAGAVLALVRIDVRLGLASEDLAAALASIAYRDSSFRRRRVYTAWDNLKDEKVFFRGIDRLEAAGIPPRHVMAYMLVGYDPAETWARIFHRFEEMTARGVLPYPMVFDPARRDLKAFQRWVVTGLYRAVPWSDYRVSTKRAPAADQDALV